MTRKASRRSRLDKSAIDVVEEAVHLLRVSAPGVLAYYYIGSLPFVLGLIYFWAYMSASAVDEGTCAAAALGMAVLLVWMKSWQAVFAAHATAQLTGQALARPTGRSVLRIAAAQAIIQPWGFILLPVAAVATLPFGWAYAFYQNATVLGGEDSDLRGLFQKARHQAMLWPRQNHFLLALLFLLGVFVLANLAVVIYLMPQLWRTLFGVETVFAKGSWHMLNTTFLAATCALSYLCMDPLVKAVYVVRCFHGASLHSGADLKAELRVRQRAEKLGAALLVAWLAWHGVCVPRGALAAGRPEPWVAIGGEAYRQPVGILGVSPEELDRSIKEVLSRPEYEWRVPRDSGAGEEKKGALAAFVRWCVDTVKGWLEPVRGWLKDLREWLDQAMERLFKHDQDQGRTGTNWPMIWKGVALALVGVLAGSLIVLFWKACKRRRPHHEVPTQAVSAAPDVADEETAADALPADRWLAMAEDLRKKGELRLALRALYLASLSYLAHRGLITVARYKSNRDYERELQRRARERVRLLEAFARNVTLFDSTWYGRREATAADLEEFIRNQRKLS